MSRCWLMLAMLAVFSLFLAGCPRQPEEPGEIGEEVEITEYQFQPQEARIKQGEAVRWNNAGQETHTVTADPARAQERANVQLPEGAKTFDSGEIEPGGSFVHTFDTPGTYRYICVLHEDQNMVGTVIVEPAEPEQAPAEQAPAEEAPAEEPGTQEPQTEQPGREPGAME